MWVRQRALARAVPALSIAQKAVARINEHSRAKRAELRKTGTCDAVDFQPNIVPVQTGFEGASKAVRSGFEPASYVSVEPEELEDLFMDPAEKTPDTEEDEGMEALFIDEAQHLEDGGLEVLRDLHDCAGVPIMVISTRDLYDRIVRDADADHGQLYSRFDIVKNITQGKDMTCGGEPLIPLSEIKAMYNRPPIRLTPDAARYLFMVANQLGYGSHRRCKSLLRNAARRARKRAKITEENAPVTVSADDLDWVERTLRQDAGEQELATERRKKLAAGGALAGV